MNRISSKARAIVAFLLAALVLGYTTRSAAGSSPEAFHDRFSTPVNRPLVIHQDDGILSNDRDPDGI